MTLIKSLLLGSAAGIVAVATAQAADLPTRKAAPVEYVRVCNVGGITGWTLPGSDTCIKLSGYVTAQFVGGNLNTEYNYGTVDQAIGAINNTPGLGAMLQARLSSSRLAGSTLATPSAFCLRPARLNKIRPTSAVKRAGRPAPTCRSTWPPTQLGAP